MTSHFFFTRTIPLLCCRGWRIILVDLRNHGRSTELPGFEPPHTLTTAAQDVTQLIQENFAGQEVAAIVGHSLGGKITLEWLSQTATSGGKVPRQVPIEHLSFCL